MSSSLSNWSYLPLQEVVGKITSGGTPKAGTPSYYGGDIPFLKIKDLTNSTRFIESASLSITERGLQNSSARVFPSGTVLTTMYGTIGVTRILRKPMATNQAIAAFLELRGITSEFLMQLINFEAEKLASMASQTTQANISATVLKEYLVDIPPLPEQKKIASILTSVDEVIENTQKQIDKLQDLKTATMNELLTKGIGHTEFKDSEFGRIPKSWEVKTLDELCSKVGSGITPKGGASVYQDQGVIFIRSQNVHFDGLVLEDVAYISEEIHLRMQGSKVIRGDVLLNITGASIGRCTVVPDVFSEANVNQHVCIIRPTNLLHNRFLNIWLSSVYGQDQIMRFQAGGNREGLNFEQIRSIRIPIPTAGEQKLAAEIIDSIQTSINTVYSKLFQTQSLKKSLMQDLLTGKVRVSVN